MLKIITWLTALVAATYTVFSYLGIFLMLGQGKIRFTLVLAAILVGVLSHLGLFLSPFVYEKRLLLRIGAMILMVPYLYAMLIPNLQKVFLLPFNSSYSGWQYYYQDYLSLIINSLFLGIIYGINIFKLIKTSSSSYK